MDASRLEPFAPVDPELGVGLAAPAVTACDGPDEHAVVQTAAKTVIVNNPARPSARRGVAERWYRIPLECIE
jgi:hypothetical protein